MASWQGTSRYRLVRELGKGGMGVVYEALDNERAQSVALKTVLDLDAAGLYRFKQEFRTLSDVVHPNLVRLHELVVSETDGVFFTMELVAGVDFLTYVRPRAADEVALSTKNTKIDGRATMPPERAESQPPCTTDLARIRPALRQLVEGVQALHVAGHVHRDLKPSNVLVAADGRVVVLDLGVAASLRRVGADGLSEEPEMVGTSTYMAPEQALGETPTPAADWYSVGVILYEALTGRPPFLGAAADVITRKNLVDAVPPSQCVHGVPPDLDALCVELLQRDADLRPTGLDLLHRLGTPSAPPRTSLAPIADATGASALFGREEQLGALRAAFERAASGHAVAVRLGGEPGAGKSAIATHFLDGLVEGREALVLRGRAYEREALPYKAVDSVVDEVSRHLARSDEEGDPIELPPGIGALARVFPVLQRVPNVVETAADVSAEPRELRVRAFEALRALLGSLGKRQPIVVYIEDAHWGDADSAALVLALVRPPDPPPLLLLMTYRSAEAAQSVFLNELRDGWSDEIERRDVPVGPLRPDDAQALARTFLDLPEELAQRTARAVARESRGNPFLVQELARSNAGNDRRAAGDTLVVLTLEDMVGRRLARLTDDARRTIEIIAVSGRPLPISVVGAAAGLHGGVGETIAGLGARRFARVGQRDGRDVVETTHDRIRETIGALLPPETLRDHHGALARALEETPGADAEAIALHWLGAGDPGRAVRYAEDAAQRSTQKLAFDHAARLIRLALEHTPPESAHAQELRARLAAALMEGGRYAESSRAYVEAAARAAPEQKVEYQRAASEQLLASGQIDDGAALLYNVLAAVGVRAPRSQLAAVLWLVVYRIWLGVLGLRFREREPSEVSQADRVRIDALCTAAAGFAIVNSVVGACMTARYLVEALRKGDRVDVMRAMAHEGSVLAASGGRPTVRERALVATSVKLAEREGTPVAGAYVHGARGIGLFLRGQFEEARKALDLGRTVPHGHAGYSSVRLFGVYTSLFLGDFNEARTRSARLLVEAEERGDKYMLVNLNTGSGMTLAAAADAPDRARRVGRDALAQWPKNTYLVQHWQAAAYGADVDLYAGDAAAGYERMKQTMPPLEKSFLLHSAFMRTMTMWVPGRVAIASIASCPDERDARLAEARRAARNLERQSSAWARSIAAQLRAIIANAEGDRTTAMAELRQALELLPKPHGMFAWWIDHRLGLLLGGEPGEALVSRAVASMRAQGIRNPDRWVGVFMPGNWADTSPVASHRDS